MPDSRAPDRQVRPLPTRLPSRNSTRKSASLAATPVTLAMLLTACGSGDDNADVTPPFKPAVITAQSCSAAATFTATAAQISLPSSGAEIASATLVAADAAGNLNGSFCKVLGRIKPVDPTAPVINFEINLPVTWNGKMLQYGGGGFDGVLITGLDPTNFAGNDTPTPLTRGYVTLGDDSGHVGGITNGSFATNDEALRNYGRQSLKKTQDVARLLVRSLYQVDAPLKSYFIGSSTGGRDALSAAQNWPDSYDAIFINRPALNYTGLRLSNIQLGRSIFQNGGAGWLNPVKTSLLLNAVMASCDTLDGVQDGLIANLPACKARADATLSSLRCPNGTDGGDNCLSDPQIATVRAMASPLQLSYPLANGVTRYGGYNLMAGMVFGPPYSSSRNFGPNGIGPQAPNYLAVTSGTKANSPNAYLTGDQWMKFFITRDAAFNTTSVDPANPGSWQQRIIDVSTQTDAASTDLDRFFARGGRIVWTHGTADEVVSTDSSVEYYQALVAKYGQAKIDASVRFYLIPGNGHGDTGPFIPVFDSLGILSDWVEKGVDPADKIVAGNSQTKAAADLSPAGTANRPLCRYPTWPKYVGAPADPNQAGSFTCVSS